MDLAEYSAKSRETWEEMAPGWMRYRDWMWKVSRVVAEDLVAKLDPQPGQTILEVAAGVGDTGFTAARAVGESGKLISTDFSKEMVASAREHAEELGLGNIEFRVMDAENMDLPEDSVDGVVCRWGYMLMSDPNAALSETRRVLRDGGRLALSVWGNPARNPWASIPGAVMVEEGHAERPAPDEPGIFALADPDRIRELVTAAGFSEPEVTEVAVEYRFEDFDEYWRFLNELAGRIAMVVKTLSQEQQDAVRERLRDWTASFKSNGGLVMPGMCVNAVTS